MRDDNALEPFVQEVRRLYPFFPAVAARVKTGFEWRGHTFPEGRLVLLDLYGTNTDPRTWDAPDEFRPERFLHRGADEFAFIPQGGGDHEKNHRCPGEWIAIELTKAFCSFFVKSIDYDVPNQNSDLDTRILPALPKSLLVVRNVRVK